MFVIEKQNQFGPTRYLADSKGYWSKDINQAWKFDSEEIAKLIKKQFNSYKVRVINI